MRKLIVGKQEIPEEAVKVIRKIYANWIIQQIEKAQYPDIKVLDDKMTKEYIAKMCYTDGLNGAIEIIKEDL
jgi:hypothetical protein